MTTIEEKLMRAIARDLVGPFWDPMQAEVALAKIKEHFVRPSEETHVLSETWAEKDIRMAERFCFRDDRSISLADQIRIVSLTRGHREKYAQELRCYSPDNT